METKYPQNYARFYGLLNMLPTSDREELKRGIVLQYTFGRTDSLREMTLQEYKSACAGMVDQIYGTKEKTDTYLRKIIRQKRSAVLHQMQLYGIDTTDWDRINAFCKNPRIAGKVFRDLSGDELDALLVKVRAIRRKNKKS